MISFKQAVRRHSMLRDVGERSGVLGEQVWAGVTGHGHLDSLSGHAVSDTIPQEYAVLVSTDDIAASFAAATLLRAFARHPEPPTPREARLIAHEGWAEFRKLADQAGHQLHGRGGDLSDAWPVFKQVQDLSLHKQRQLQEIAMLAGRMLAALKGAQEKRVIDVPEQVVGVTTGGDVQALLPPEYAMLALPQTRMEATRRLLGRETQQYQRSGTEKMARGPLAILVDESGSMEGDRNTWAKAAATALTRLAWEHKRDVVWVHFSTATRVSVLKPGDHVALAKAQTSFLDGGTDIGAALDVGADEIKALAKRGQKGADAVLISDGGNELSSRNTARLDASLDALDALNARLFSVAISVPFRGAIKDRAARYVHLSAADMRSTDGAVAVGAAAGK